MRFLATLAVLCGLAAPVAANNYYETVISTGTSIATMSVSGYIDLAAAATSSKTFTVTIDGPQGAITKGAWKGTSVATQFGGTGQNWSAIAQGNIPYFSGAGILSALAPGTNGQVLSTAGAGANPLWISFSASTSGWANNIKGGSANQVHIQTAADTTGFVGPLTNGQLLIGSTGNPPVAASPTCTANEVSCTTGAGTLTIGGNGQQATCTSNQALLSATYNHGIATGGTCTTVVLSGSSNPQPAWQGINYVVWESSGPVIFDSTATFSFNVEASSAVFQGSIYALAKQNFAVVASTYTLISWNPTNGYRQFGLKDFMPPTISSMTAALKDDLVIALSSSDANGVISLFESVWTSPNPGWFFSGTGSTAFTNLTSGQIAAFYDCKTHLPYSLPSCDTNRVKPVFTGPGGIGLAVATHLSQADANKWCAIVNNTSGSSANAQLYEPSGSAATSWVTVDGVQPGTVNNASRTPKPVAIGTGYHPVCVYLDIPAGAQYNFDFYLPQNVAIVRGGEW